MNLLITSAACPLAQALANALAGEHQIRLTERVFVESDHEFAQCALGHDAATNLLVRGMDAIVHVAEPLPRSNENEQIDYLTRCTYNLLWAASQEGAPRVVLLSTLDLMTQYDENFTVFERWKPVPTTDPRALSKHLGEFTCREFARERKISVVVLRLGKVVRADEVKDQPFDPMWVDERDVAHAVSCALTADVRRWAIFHIQHDSPRARFSVANAKRGLGFSPQVNFQ
jgi:NAD+ dependent glucose-6-phosphate dehydrogenase/L-arabinose 1-dehydrogenase [NAD(P)+]